MVTKTKVILSGTTVVVPADWNSSSNTVHTIGGAGAGATGTSASDKGGGGGAYAAEINVTLTPGATIDIQVGAGGVHGVSAATASWLKNGGEIGRASCRERVSSPV